MRAESGRWESPRRSSHQFNTHRPVPVAPRALECAVQQDVVNMTGVHLKVPSGDIPVCVFLLGGERAGGDGVLVLERTLANERSA